MMMDPVMPTILWETAASNFVSNLPLGWYAVSMTIVLAIAFALILMFMLSRLFQSHSLQQTIKREMFQLGATVIMITILLGFESTTRFIIAGNNDLRDLISEKAAEQLLGKSGYLVNIFDVSYVYFTSSLNCLKQRFEQHLAGQSNEILTRISLTADVLGAQIPLPLAPIFIPQWTQLMKDIIYAEDVLWLSISTYFQINFLQWIEASMVSVYLPIGILLRAVPFTRGGGAAIMAIAISLYFVYPFLLTVMFFNGPSLPKECAVNIKVQEGPPGGTTKKPKVCPSDPTSVEAYFGSESASSSPSSSGAQQITASGFDTVRLYAYFFPFIAMVGTLLFARSLAQVLGGNISDIGRGMVRVI